MLSPSFLGKTQGPRSLTPQLSPMCTHHSFLPKDPGSSSPSPRAQSPPRHPPDTLYKSFLPSESSPIPLSLGLGFYELTLHFIPPWGLRWDLQGDTRGWKEQGQKGLSLESGEEAPPPFSLTSGSHP